MSDILYNDRQEIGAHELANIYMALITSGDSVYVNANIQPSKYADKRTYNHIANSLDCLSDKGLIKRWCYPYEIPSLHRPELTLISTSEYQTWEGAIRETYLKGDNLVSLINRIDQSTILTEERTSKIISTKREYWNFAVCTILNLDQILNNYGGWQPISLSTSSKFMYTSVKKPVANRLFEKYKIPSLFPLSGEDVVHLHSRNKDFRKMVDDKIKEVSVGEEDNNVIIDKAINRITQDLLEILDRATRSGLRGAVDNLLVNCIGLIFPPFAWTSNLNDFFTQLVLRRNHRFLYFISDVKAISQKRGQTA